MEQKMIQHPKSYGKRQKKRKSDSLFFSCLLPLLSSYGKGNLMREKVISGDEKRTLESSWNGTKGIHQKKGIEDTTTGAGGGRRSSRAISMDWQEGISYDLLNLFSSLRASHLLFMWFTAIFLWTLFLLLKWWHQVNKYCLTISLDDSSSCLSFLSSHATSDSTKDN